MKASDGMCVRACESVRAGDGEGDGDGDRRSAAGEDEEAPFKNGVMERSTENQTRSDGARRRRRRWWTLQLLMLLLCC